MAPKVKEDEKLERTIRGLLKLPENRRCINCNSLGPQYVCTTFCTFVCMNCSGIHREFTHRVKSISMAKFTPEEVSALQAGGNERARQIYLKEWDPQRHSHPDGSNLYKLRDFIKHVYVDRRFSGERSEEKLPRLRLTDKEESYSSRSSNAYRGASGSPSYEDRYERPYSGRSSPSGRSDDGILKYYPDERRSPRYARETSRYGGYRRSPVHFEVVDDRFRDDLFRGGRRSQGPRRSYEESRLGSRSPENQKNMDKSTATITRPAKEISGDDGLSRRAGEKTEKSDGCANVKKVRSLNDLGKTDGSAVEKKEAKSQSVTEIRTDEKPPDASAETQRQQMPSSTDEKAPNASAETQRQEVPSSTDGGDWASFAPSAKEKAPSASNASTLEMLLLELTPAAVTDGNVSEGLSGHDAQPTASVSNTSPTGIPSDAPAEQISGTADVPTQQALVLVDDPTTSTSVASTGHISEEPPKVAPENHVDLLEQLPSTQQCQPPAAPSNNKSYAVEKNEQLPLTLLELNEQGPSCNSSQSGETTVQGVSSGLASQNLPIEPNPSTRTELPADLFTAFYPPAPAPIQGWQTARPHAMGFNMQYYPNMTPMPTYLSSARSTNPFDLADGTDQPQGPAVGTTF
ncbi:hypothetical protein BT93_L1448 [Corymbia citriodora subsp. variegata]|uniref:Arf-GAP domain-containing protein n=1 Tax=Corymbia citriodora subsp. variegata TaxID=360336 RepID=A0A8T0CQ49_CORYI|nr:hypothetical protein BT93_L1448 [Corymbia citriodora subsp. variegata]